MSYEQTIYNTFRKHGITQAGALGFLGNWACESGNEPFRLQGDFSPYRTMSKAYVQGITNGTISKKQMQSDQKGFGLAQWTYWSRKAALYEWWKSSGKVLDSAEMQTEFAINELGTEYRALFDFLKSTNDIFTACSRICREYERPAVNNIDARYQAANRIKYEIDLDGSADPEPEPTPAPTPTPSKDHTLTLRTIDWHCENFKEFALLKALLECRNYDTADWDNDGVWDALALFQKESGLVADKICGNNTWNALLKR